MKSVQHVTSSDGTRIAYSASGSGEPVLLVHGTGTWSADWLFVMPFLEGRFTVVTMDRRGRGESGDGPQYSIEREAADVLAVLEAVRAELLVGHSYGAMCSTLAAERTESLRGLVLYEPPIGAGGEGVEAIEALIAKGKLDSALEGFLRAVGISDEDFAAIRSSPAWPSLAEVVPTLPRELRACAGWSHPYGPIEVPTLFLRGARTQSRFYLDGFDELAAAFPQGRQESIPDQLHVAHVFAAEAFAGLVADFFTGLG